MREHKERIERVGQRLLDTIPSHPNVQFIVVNGDPSINAGATFGQVAVTSGMLDFIESDDEMAIVLGHELAHVTEGHVMKGAIGGLALNVLAIVLETQAPGAGQAAGGVGQLFLNHYTQTQEREADDVGLRYAYQAGYDPRAAVDVQERLAVQVPQSMSAGYFDTHPSSVERAVAAREEARELLAQGDPPGRSEVLALERADQRTRQASRSNAGTASSGSSFGASPSGRIAAPAPSGAVDSEDCRRAAVYAEMARDARDPEERQQLERRAARYCPSLAGGSSSTGSGPTSRDADPPLDRY
jgi:predicted Zn-dependent protease